MIEMEIVSQHEVTLITSTIAMLESFIKETRKKAWSSSGLVMNGQDACNVGATVERAQMASESLFQVLNCASAYFECPNAKAALDERHKVYNETA